MRIRGQGVFNKKFLSIKLVDKLVFLDGQATVQGCTILQLIEFILFYREKVKF